MEANQISVKIRPVITNLTFNQTGFLLGSYDRLAEHLQEYLYAVSNA